MQLVPRSPHQPGSATAMPQRVAFAFPACEAKGVNNVDPRQFARGRRRVERIRGNRVDLAPFDRAPTDYPGQLATANGVAAGVGEFARGQAGEAAATSANDEVEVTAAATHCTAQVVAGEGENQTTQLAL